MRCERAGAHASHSSTSRETQLRGRRVQAALGITCRCQNAQIPVEPRLSLSSKVDPPTRRMIGRPVWSGPKNFATLTAIPGVVAEDGCDEQPTLYLILVVSIDSSCLEMVLVAWPSLFLRPDSYMQNIISDI
jgi:hypothetical protein